MRACASVTSTGVIACAKAGRSRSLRCRKEPAITKEHYLSFIACVTPGAVLIKKLYPEQAAEARFAKQGIGMIYLYCNRHGLFRMKTPRSECPRAPRLPSGA